MNKLILAAMGFMLGCGSIIGYSLAKWDLQTNGFTNSQNAIAASPLDAQPKQVNLKPPAPRSELELKYGICTNSTPGKNVLARFDDKALNDLVYKVCTN